MSKLDVATKECSSCEKIKPLTEFYRDKTRRDGRRPACAECEKARVQEYQARKREEMGEEAWREYRKEVVERHRSKRRQETGSYYAPYQRAYTKAMHRLRETHPDTFARLLDEERYKLGLEPKGEE